MNKTRFTSYPEVMAFLFSQLPMYQNKGPKAIKYDLSNIRKLLTALGDPHENFNSIHIAGTNGKGSTAHLIAAAFQKNSYKTGLYTSPHYKDFRERIKVDGHFVKEQFLVDFMNENYELIGEINPTYFELSVAMAFSYFSYSKVDMAIVEVGLGGRLDSTNVITPMLSVITNISLDHTQTLGDTLKAIAREKAGIIKKGIPVLIGEKQDETTSVYQSIAGDKNASLYFSEQFVNESEKKISTPEINGPFHKKNLQTSKAAVQVFKLHYKNWNLNMEQAYAGMAQFKELTSYIGRWTQLGEKPVIIADGAHNAGSWRETTRFFNRSPYKQLHIVIGFVYDKSHDEILKLLPENAKYYFCQAQVQRALDAESLRLMAENYNLKGQSFLTVAKALKEAKRQAAEEDLIFVGGSIFVVGEVL